MSKRSQVIGSANRGDRSDDAMPAWPEDRRRVEIGTRVVRQAQDEADGPVIRPMSRPRLDRFTGLQRGLHWLMATMVLAMLFIGADMVATLTQTGYGTLISIHKPLGVSILALALLRLGVRLRQGSPPLPPDLPGWQAAAAKASHVVLYALLIAMPLAGWSMLSAGGDPLVLYGPVRLPPIAPQSDALYAILHAVHAWLAVLLFGVILLHLSAALFHGLIRRDGVFGAMAPWPARRR